MELIIGDKPTEELAHVFEVNINTMVGDGDEFQRVIKRFTDEHTAIKFLEFANWISSRDNAEMRRSEAEKIVALQFGDEAKEWLAEWPYDHNVPCFFYPYTTTVSYFDGASRRFPVRIKKDG